jgi:hypothetical protein
MKIKYSSNNSGGRWWLKDEDWLALETAGWKVDWYKDRTDRSFIGEADRFLGALASKAKREGLTMEEAVAEWERITSANSTDIGCPCCGNPHTFTEYDDEGKYVRSGPAVQYFASW